MTETDLSPWRTGVITGSRIAKVLDLSTFGGPEDVMREMVREHFGATSEFEGNMITDHGQRYEAEAIEAYERENRLLVYGSQTFIPHPSLHWAGVTPDGLVGTAGMVEVKVPWRAKYVHISQRPGYECQIRWQLDCAQREWCDFVVYRPQLPKVVMPGLWVSRVERNPQWMDEEWTLANGQAMPPVRPVVQAFIDRYHEIIADPERAQVYLDPLQDQRDDEAWAEAAEAYLEALATQRATERDTEDARKALIALSNGKTSVGYGVRVQHSERKGSIDYAAIAKAHAAGVDPEQYRKDPTHVVSVNLTGGKK